MKTIISGAVAGLAGTTAMTLAMFSLEKVGLAPGKPPPKEIIENLQEKLGIRDKLPKPVTEGSWIIMHFGYGTISGAAYAVVQEALNRDKPLLLVGALFGILLWAVGYCAWLPAFGLYPPPTRLSQSKVGAELIATHLIYGMATTATHRMLQSKSGTS
jgi:uncharacterized membrane protein YagU involved in acid resistance